MAARTLDQILAALDSGYAGSRQLILDKQNALPGQADAEIAGLDAKLQDANTNIVDAARRRGLGFSGIPVAEQAKYAATDYAPAVARVREGARSQAMSLQEALLGLGRDQRTQAESIYNNETQRDLQERQLQEQIRQFNENLAFQREQAAEARRAAAASAGGGYSLGGGGYSGGAGGGGGAAPKAQINGVQQKAYNDVRTRVEATRDKNTLMSDYLATAASAKRGNQYDLYKLQVYRQMRPDLFKAKYSWE